MTASWNSPARALQRPPSSCRRIAAVRTLLLAFLAALPAAALAQTYKCIDAEKRVTYSNTACDKQGLKDAGPVADRVMTVPATEMQKGAPRREPAKTLPSTEKQAK